MPPRRTGGKSDKAHKNTKTTLTGKNTDLDASVTKSTLPRFSPKDHNTRKKTPKGISTSLDNKSLTKGTHPTTKEISSARSEKTRPSISKATVKPTAAANPQSKSKVPKSPVVKSNCRQSGRLQGADPTPPLELVHDPQKRRKPKSPARFRDNTAQSSRPSDCHHTETHRKETANSPKAPAIGSLELDQQTSDSAPRPNPDPAHDAEPYTDPVQEDCHALGSRQVLTVEALRDFNRALASTDLASRNRFVEDTAIYCVQEESEDEDSQVSSTYSGERYYRKLGYVPPLDEETTRIMDAIIKTPERVHEVVGIKLGTDEWEQGLDDRNVLYEPSDYLDPYGDKIQSTPPGGLMQETEDQKRLQEDLWRFDKAKCTAYSKEPLYQRTLMISLIARHALIYEMYSGTEPIFDFSVEGLWTCPPMPSKSAWIYQKYGGAEPKLLSQPKPDLSVSFLRKAVMSDSTWKALPSSTRGLACIENNASSGIFHFLAVEAKNAQTLLGSRAALHQCLNDASQALHNMFEFLKDAGYEKEFYDKVRFFSIVANSQGILVRIHRAIEKPGDTNATLLIMPDKPNYRLEFEFREFQRIEGADAFSRARALEVMEKIFQYAKTDLLSLLQLAASSLHDRLWRDPKSIPARRDVGFYCYELYRSKASRSKRTSVATTPVAVRGHLERTKLRSTFTRSQQSEPSGQTTPRQRHREVTQSLLGKASKKRSRDETMSDGTESMSMHDRPVRKTRRQSYMRE